MLSFTSNMFQIKKKTQEQQQTGGQLALAEVLTVCHKLSGLNYLYWIFFSVQISLYFC